MALGGFVGWIAALGIARLLACGPFFPNSLLQDHERAVLTAPGIRFAAEIARFASPPPRGLHHQASEESPAEVTTRAEVKDVRAALTANGGDTNRVQAVLGELTEWRRHLTEYRDRLATWEYRQERAPAAAPDAHDADAGEPRPAPAGPAAVSPRPTWEGPSIPEGLPEEFREYLRGALAWHQGATNAARETWEALLRRPAAERPYRTVWATYMLGRTWHDEAPEKAIRQYQQTRSAVRAGFGDSAELAVASLGWEAQLALRAGDFATALRLYGDQWAAGDTNRAALSLGWATERALRAPRETRLALARVPQFRHWITARVLADHDGSTFVTPVPRVPSTNDPVELWLETLEEVGAADVQLAEQLALLRYQRGDWEGAARWIDLAGDSVVAQWIQAKLKLRAGELAEGTALLSTVITRLRDPRDPRDPREAATAARGNARPSATFADSVGLRDDDGEDATRQALGELGVVQVARGDFVQALDALARGGFWLDAAYVAERVLTVDELKRYVDQRWPGTSPTTTVVDPDAPPSAQPEAGVRRPVGSELRHLLARRLTRVSRGSEATAYFPTNLVEAQRELLRQLAAGENTNAAPLVRARAMFAAAQRLREDGLELIGTETAPDWAYVGGQYELDLTYQERARGPRRDDAEVDEEIVRRSAVADASLTRTNVARFGPTPEELRRAQAHAADPEQRFHYRYQAALLAWNAAALLPANDPEKALMLYHGGSWLKVRDPQTADLFYKALVRTCRKTELGDAADRQRWFPPLDATGKPYVTRRQRPAPPTILLPDEQEMSAPGVEEFELVEPAALEPGEAPPPSSTTEPAAPLLE